MTQQDRMVEIARGLVRIILTTPHVWEWTVQGFGMLRCYPSDNADRTVRLNVWDSRLKVPNVSTIHDHPWHLQSWVLAGRMGNVRFHENERPETFGQEYDWMDIHTGIEAGEQIHNVHRMWLWAGPFESYEVGDTYKQFATEIHKSFPSDGAVTLNARERVGTGDHARVFWPRGEDWVDAKPRIATWQEVEDATKLALEGWDNGPTR